MAMDVLERLNRKFGVWYEGLVGGAESRDLRPRDILRRILAAMEDGRREALDGQIYVPNVYTLQLAVTDEDERSYLRTFLSAEDLSVAVMRSIEQHNYQVRGSLIFNIEEVDPIKIPERVRIQCRFDATVSSPNPGRPPAVELPNLKYDADDEPGTVPSAMNPPLASLVVRGAAGRLEDVFPLTARGARIGRGRQAGNDIVVPGDALISKVHASIRYDQGQFVLIDEKSTNGTMLRGERLQPGRGYPLHPGDEVRLGDTTLLFRPTGAFSPMPMQPPAVSMAPMIALNSRSAPLVASQSGPFRLVAGDGETHTLASAMGIGRSLTSDIVVIGNGVANQHARLFQQGESIYVEDLATAGGTQVNGERIPANFPVALYDGDQLGFGEVQFRLERGNSGATIGLDRSGWRQ